MEPTRDERRSEVDDLVLVRLAHVEDEDVFFGVEFALEGFDCDLRDAVDGGGFGYGLITRDFEWTDGGGLFEAAELVVVDEFLDLVGAAGGALGFFAEFEGAKVHAEGVDEQEAADEWVADAED